MTPDFDTAIVKPLIEVAKLDKGSLLQLLQVALSPDLARLIQTDDSVEMRLSLLQPSFVYSQLVSPLSRYGVANAHRVIRRCPELIVAAVMKEEEEEEEGGTSSRLQVALSTLNGLLSRKDLSAVVRNFPCKCVKFASSLPHQPS